MSITRKRESENLFRTKATGNQSKASSPIMVNPLEELQSAIGNQAMGRMLSAQAFQAKSKFPLRFSSTAIYDERGSAVAAGIVQGKFKFKGLSREILDRSQPLSSLAHDTAQKQPDISDNSFPLQLKSCGSGLPLPSDVRDKMEQSFNTDFTDVRVHRGSEAKAIGALAFTQGNNIYFQPEQYNPKSLAGQTLLGHELTHVVQQRAGLVKPQSRRGDLSINADSTLEAEADRLGAKAAHGGIAQVTKTGVGLQRQAEVAQQKQQQRQKNIKELKEEAARKEHKEESKESRAGAGYIVTQEGLTKRSAEAEASAKKILEATDEEVKLAVEALAKAGVLGEASQKSAIQRGAFSARAEGSAKGSAQAETSAKASAIGDVIEGLKLLAEVSAKASTETDLQSRLALAAGPLQAELLAKLHVAAGALAEAKGKFELGLAKGLIAEFSAKASAMVEASGEVSTSVGAYELKADLKAEGEAKAGAEASAEGTCTITLTEVKASGKLEAFAGAKAKGSAGTSLTYKGKVLAKLSATAEASAGIGGEVKGEFSYNHGTITMGGKVAATLGFGGGAETAVEVNPKEIMKATAGVFKDGIVGEVKKHQAKKNIDRRTPSNRSRYSIPSGEKDAIAKQLREAVIYDFEAYGLKKSESGKHGIKKEAVQDILDNKVILHDILKVYILCKESDAILEEAAKDAFGSQLKSIKIVAGNIKSFEEGTKKKIYSTLNELRTVLPTK